MNLNSSSASQNAVNTSFPFQDLGPSNSHLPNMGGGFFFDPPPDDRRPPFSFYPITIVPNALLNFSAFNFPTIFDPSKKFSEYWKNLPTSMSEVKAYIRNLFADLFISHSETLVVGMFKFQERQREEGRPRSDTQGSKASVDSFGFEIEGAKKEPAQRDTVILRLPDDDELASGAQGAPPELDYLEPVAAQNNYEYDGAPSNVDNPYYNEGAARVWASDLGAKGNEEPLYDEKIDGAQGGAENKEYVAQGTGARQRDLYAPLDDQLLPPGESAHEPEFEKGPQARVTMRRPQKQGIVAKVTQLFENMIRQALGLEDDDFTEAFAKGEDQGQMTKEALYRALGYTNREALDAELKELGLPGLDEKHQPFDLRRSVRTVYGFEDLDDSNAPQSISEQILAAVGKAHKLVENANALFYSKEQNEEALSSFKDLLYTMQQFDGKHRHLVIALTWQLAELQTSSPQEQERIRGLNQALETMKYKPLTDFFADILQKRKKEAKDPHLDIDAFFAPNLILTHLQFDRDYRRYLEGYDQIGIELVNIAIGDARAKELRKKIALLKSGDQEATKTFYAQIDVASKEEMDAKKDEIYREMSGSTQKEREEAIRNALQEIERRYHQIKKEFALTHFINTRNTVSDFLIDFYEKYAEPAAE